MHIPAALIAAIRWNEQGLVPAVVQDARSGKVLMMAWMNAEALTCTLDEQRAVFWSRSRNSLWRKGESSGHVQTLRDIRLDCDGDTLLLQVEQIGGIACHTGRESCFYLGLDGNEWKAVEPVVRDPDDIYGSRA
jgi:phosphoribosyl-AMP cyclohydrolase